MNDPSFRRSVVPSFRRSLGVFSVLTLAWIVGAPAFAQTQLVPMDTVVFDASEPGVLVVDASDHKMFLPLLADTRVFKDREEYVDYLHHVLNFNPMKPDGFELSVAILGRTYSYSPDLQSIIPVSDPIATFLGGRYGFIQVGDEKFCVDRDRCQDPVHYYMLSPWEGDEGLMASDSSLAAQTSSPYSIHGFVRYAWRPSPSAPSYQNGVSEAVTLQRAGGFQIHSITWQEATLVCGSYLLGEAECHYRPGRSMMTETSGRNELIAGVTREGRLSDDGVCHKIPVAMDPKKERGRNVPSVKVQRIVHYNAEVAQKLRFEVRPTHLKGEHKGEDRNTGAEAEMESYIATGVTPDCTVYGDPQP